MSFGRKEKKEDFFDLFSQAAENLVVGTDYLSQIIHTTDQAREDARNKLHDVEHESDLVTHKISNLLNSTFITPLDRDDIRMIASALDDCMDFIDEAGDLIVLYNLDDIPRRLAKQVEVLQACASLTATAIPRLKAKRKDLKDYTIEINSLENKGDKAYRKMLAELFSTSNLDPILVIKIKDIIESLERGCDSFEKLANTIETVCIKES